LIVWLCRAPASVRNRLFPRQIWYLALADLLFVLSDLPQALVAEQVFELPPKIAGRVCAWTTTIFKFFRHVALWTEMHIAVSFLLVSFKVRTWEPLRVSLRLVWVPGLLLASCSALANPWTYDALNHVCAPESWTGSAGPLDIADFALCLFICAFSHVTVVCRSWARHSPGSVQLRATLRAQSYLLDALLTYGPIFVCYTNSNLYLNSWCRSVADMFELLGGFFNTVTYALQSRYSSALRGQPNLLRENLGARQKPSYTVDVSGGAEVVDAASYAAYFSPVTTFEIDETGSI